MRAALLTAHLALSASRTQRAHVTRSHREERKERTQRPFALRRPTWGSSTNCFEPSREEHPPPWMFRRPGRRRPTRSRTAPPLSSSVDLRAPIGLGCHTCVPVCVFLCVILRVCSCARRIGRHTRAHEPFLEVRVLARRRPTEGRAHACKERGASAPPSVAAPSPRDVSASSSGWQDRSSAAAAVRFDAHRGAPLTLQNKTGAAACRAKRPPTAAAR